MKDFLVNDGFHNYEICLFEDRVQKSSPSSNCCSDHHCYIESAISGQSWTVARLVNNNDEDKMDMATKSIRRISIWSGVPKFIVYRILQRKPNTLSYYESGFKRMGIFTFHNLHDWNYVNLRTFPTPIFNQTVGRENWWQINWTIWATRKCLSFFFYKIISYST